MIAGLAKTTARLLPLDGGGWVGVLRAPISSYPTTPHPNPPRKGEGAASCSGEAL